MKSSQTSPRAKPFSSPAHGNSLRALVKHLDGLSDDEIAELNIPTGIPLVYRLDANFQPLVKGGEYLDPEAAAAGAAAAGSSGQQKVTLGSCGSLMFVLPWDCRFEQS
jgi:hypothetical protein